MRNAILKVFTFDVTCPHCDELIENSEGSLSWPIPDSVPNIITCHNCNTELTMPKKVAGGEVTRSSELEKG